MYKRVRLSDKVWIKPDKELSRYFKLVTFLFSMSEVAEETKVLMKRIKRLNTRSGSNFTFLYLKECLRLVIKYLVGSGENTFLNKGVYVSRDLNGLPTILSKKLRWQLMDGKEDVVKFVCTLLSVFRIFPSSQKIKLSTITKPFDGISKVLDRDRINVCVEELLKDSFVKPRPIKFVKLETSSPYSFKSAWGAAVIL